MYSVSTGSSPSWTSETEIWLDPEDPSSLGWSIDLTEHAEDPDEGDTVEIVVITFGSAASQLFVRNEF